jgi:histone-lysine N-methyltransferase SETMAR
MELTREQIRLLLMHEYLLESDATEAARRINKAWGDGTIGERTAREWFAKFRNGEEGLEDKSRSGRPQEVVRQAVLAAIEETPSLTTRMLAEDFDCEQSTIVRILHELGKVWKKTRWVPHELTPAQKTKRLNAAQALLDRHCRASFLDQLITGDEKWVSFSNPDPQHEWLSPDQKATEERFSTQEGCVFWSVHGVVFWELLEQGQNVNSEVYCRQLDQVNRQLRRRHGQVVFLDDNAKPHRSRVTNAKVAELSWTVSTIHHTLRIWRRRTFICFGHCNTS